MIRNIDIKRKCENKDPLLERVDQSALRWFGQMETMDDSKFKKRT